MTNNISNWNILIIEDNDDDYELLLYNLKKGLPQNFNNLRTISLADSIKALKSKNFDIILTDLNLIDESGIIVVQKIHNLFPKIPLIVLTGNDNLDIAIDAVSKGAQDFIVKGTIPAEALARTINFSIIRKKVENNITADRLDAINKEEMKSFFLANLTHDLKTPLTSLLNACDLLPLGSEEKVNELIDIIKKSGKNLSYVINDVLDISALDANQVVLKNQTINFPEKIKQSTTPFAFSAKEKGLIFNMTLDENLPKYIETDFHCLMRVVSNLLSNAIKFTQAGRVDVIVKSINENEISIEVNDTGIGIPQESQSEIFSSFQQGDQFVSTKYGGSGLGLAICLKRAILLNGQISFNSVEGEGSSFIFTFPFKIAEKVETVQIKKDFSAPVSKDLSYKVLVVEDCVANHQILKLLLKDSPYLLDFVINGHEAIKKVESELYSLILMDMKMDGLDGYETTKIIREMEKKQRISKQTIVAFTASTMPEEVEKCMESGCDDLFAKPFTKEKLFELLERYTATPIEFNHGS